MADVSARAVPAPDEQRLTTAVAEIETHVAAAGWDVSPALFALVRADRFAADDPRGAARLGLDRLAGETLTPIEQDALPEGALDEVLAGLAWPQSIVGCALSQEIVILPPAAEESLGADQIAERAAGHPDRREARLVVGVLRGGASAAVLRLRGEPELLTGPDLAPNLVSALLATLD